MIDLGPMRAASGIGKNAQKFIDENMPKKPNIIGNQEDKEGGQGGDETMYRSITPKRTEAQKERMQQQ